MKHNHFPTWLFISTLALFGINACNDTDDSTSDTPQCSPECTGDQECVEGQCQPKQNQDNKTCVPECGENEECIEGTCKPKQTQDDKACNPACNADQECIEGTCKPKQNQDDNVCNPECDDEEECIEGTCKPKQTQDDKACNPACNADQECIEGTCKPKDEPKTCDPECKDDEECVEGTCKPKDEQKVCNPQCKDDEECIEGTCKPKNEPKVCNPQCGDEEECVEGQCKPFEEQPPEVQPPEPIEPPDLPYEFYVTPSEGLSTVTGSTVSFNLTLNQAPSKDVIIPLVNQNTKAGTLSTDKVIFTSDNWNSPQQVMIAGTKEILEEPVVTYTIKVGPTESKDEHFNKLDAVNIKISHHTINGSDSDKPKSLTLDTKKASLLLYGEAVTIQATLDKDAKDKIVYWEIENTTDNINWERLVNANYDMNKHTITLQSNVVLNTSDTKKDHLDYARTLKVTAKHSSGLSASATVELKPYLPARGFTLTKLKQNIKDFVTPGHQLNKCANNDDTAKCINESQGKYKNKSTVIQYTKGEMGCGYYDDHTAQVLTYDMFNDFVKPAMYKNDKGDYYGTRASVVAAARFLVVQFPKDIPYASAHLISDTTLKGNTGKLAVPTVANFTWANNKNIKDETADEAKKKYRVFGLNLMKKAYNSFTKFTENEVVLGGTNMNTVVPWGCSVPPKDGKPIMKGDKAVPYPYNGLCCSGYVSWALRSGRFYLGNWPTIIFGKNGNCQDTKGNYVRNFRCRQFFGEEQKDTDTYKVKEGVKTTIANPKSKHENAFAKMNMLKDEDFVEVSSLTVNSDITAGDLLWYGTHTCNVSNGKCQIDGNNCYEGGGGHVAMILGISRSGKKINKVYVSEAIHVNGNHLAAYTIDELKNSWKSTQKVSSNKCSYKDVRLIKMDRVYNYAHTKNPETVKEDLNTYKYTELWF